MRKWALAELELRSMSWRSVFTSLQVHPICCDSQRRKKEGHWSRTSAKRGALSACLHQPMEIVVDGRRVRVVDFHHRREVLGRDEYLVLVKDDARQVDPPVDEVKAA